MRLTLFHNPSAGHGRHSADDIEQIARALGHSVLAVSIEHPDWVAALEHPGELVVVAGGDGTVRTIAVRMLGRPEPIAVVPMGTANNVASALGVLGTTRELIESWATSHPIGFDVGIVEGEGRRHLFLECVGVGEFGRLMAHSDAIERSSREEDRERKLERDVVLLRDRIAAGEVQGVDLVVDGVDRGGEYLLAEVLNLRSFGPRLGLAPLAQVNDGMLHVVLVTRDDRAALVDYLERLRHGDTRPPDLEVIPARRVELQCSGRDLHVDGELWELDSGVLLPNHRVAVEVSLLPEAVRFLRPGAPASP